MNGISNIYFPICSLLISILILIVFYLSKRIDNIETKIYGKLIIINFFESLIACSIVITALTFNSYNFLFFLDKIDYILIFSWIWLLFCYTYLLCFNKPNKYFKLNVFINIIICIFIFITDIVIVNENGIMNSYGLSNDILLISVFVYLFFIVIFTIIGFIKSKDKNSRKKYIPIGILILFIIFMIIVRFLKPELVLLSFIISFIDLIMYHTIENPDMKMLKEIQQSKEFAEQANNEKAMFLYNTSQELKTPVNAIGERCEELLQEQDINEIMNGIKDIKFAAKKLSTTISGTLDMNRTLVSNIEIKVSRYSTKMLFQEMVSMSKLNMKEKNIDFRVKLDDAIPEYLMGDAIRLKQIIQTIMNNAIKHTEKGFIEFNVSSVIKHDVCRLIITIEDSGAGIESKKLETLFYNTEDEDQLDEERLNNVGDTRESLSVVKILTNLIGGTVIVNSELGKGSKFTVVLDQQIAETKKSSTEIAVESLSSNKRILVVDDEEENLKQIAKLLSKYEVNVEVVEWGQECLEKIRKKQKYDLILLDEDMPRLNGIKTFEKLKLEEDFNVPVIIMITNNHIEYKDRYLYNGFGGCVVKPLKKQDVEKLIKKYIKTGE